MKQSVPYPVHTHLRSRLPAESVVVSFLQHHFTDSTGPVLIAIGGPGGSGKTTFAGKLARRLHASGVVHLDNYKLPRSERQAAKLAGPDPAANDMELVFQHLTAIKSGSNVSVPQYDHSSGRTGSFQEYTPRRFNIIEGEISTYPRFRPLIDCSIFIDSDFKTQLAARTGRDVHELGHSLEKAIGTFLSSNLTAFTRYGAESKRWADLHLFCHEDYHFSIEAVRSDFYSRLYPMLHEAGRVSPAGLIVPVTTPFGGDLSICQTAFIEHLAFLSERGVTKLIVGGTTAEFFSLTVSERLTLLKLSREYFPGYLIFNASGDNLATTVELVKKGYRYGADALICLPPWYYAKAPVTGIINYFKIAADTCDLPFYLYNFPRHTGNPITPEILGAVPHAGLKDSSADLGLIPACNKYLLGGDSKITEAYRKGACGFIPGLPNAFPGIYLAMEQAVHEKNDNVAERLQNQISSFKRSVSGISGIVTVKRMLGKLLGTYPTAVRPPLDAIPEGFVDPPEELIGSMAESQI